MIRSVLREATVAQFVYPVGEVGRLRVMCR